MRIFCLVITYGYLEYFKYGLKHHFLFVFKQKFMWRERICKQSSRGLVRELVTDVLAPCEQKRGTVAIVQLTTPQTHETCHQDGMQEIYWGRGREMSVKDTEKDQENGRTVFRP